MVRADGRAAGLPVISILIFKVPQKAKMRLEGSWMREALRGEGSLGCGQGRGEGAREALSLLAWQRGHPHLPSRPVMKNAFEEAREPL